MPRLLLILVLLPLACPLLPGQGLEPPRRAAYDYPFGRAWSAAVDQPAYSILDLGLDNRPLAVNDSGTVLYRDGNGRLVRWAGGLAEVLDDRQPLGFPAYLNEGNVVASVREDIPWEPEVHVWYHGEPAPVVLPWGNALVERPLYAWLCALNDRDQLVLNTESFYEPVGNEDELYQIETNLVDLTSGTFTEWSLHESRITYDWEFSVTGIRYQVTGLNNYGMSVGRVLEEITGSDEVSDYYSLDLQTVLDFEPLGINDAGTILGQTAPPLSGLVLLDNFGQRYIGPYLPELESAGARMSSPDNGLEEIIVGPHYFKRMSERDIEGNPTGTPSPDFWQGSIEDLVPAPGRWQMLEGTAISANGRIAGTGWLYNLESAQYEQHGFLLLPPVLVPDWDRNGQIDTFDREYCYRGEPWRFWINNDDDEGDDSRSYADDLPWSESPDWASPGMDGLRDGVDFFPLLLDLHPELLYMADTDGLDIRLRQADAALNLVYTRLQPGEVSRLLDEDLEEGFGPAGDEPFGDCPTVAVSAEGILLERSFINRIRDANQGVILLEGTRPSQQPLVVDLLRDGAVVYSSSLPLSISPVEDMFRIINLRRCDPKFADSDPGPWLTRTTMPPNLPDTYLESFTKPLRTLVHIHGFNWGGDEIPAAHAELFKRFYQAGSNARYIGIIWYGDEGTLDLTDSSLTYNENVINAFITAGYMTESLLPFSGPFTYALAHSLGNMLTSAAIVDHGLSLGRYFLLNAAVALESYTGEMEDRRIMVHPDWKDEPGSIPDYAEHLLSANWSRFFPAGDNRSLLRWKERFSTLTQATPCTQYYSTGEDVLRAGDGALPALFDDVADQELVWVYNEMIKGTTALTAPLSTEVHGGWGFNLEHMKWVDPGGPAHPPAGSYEPVAPAEAENIPLSELITEPFFRPFDDGESDWPTWENGQWLYGNTADANAHLPGWPLSSGTLEQVKNHAKILAEAIPGHSAPAGCRPIDQLLLLENINLDQACRDQDFWPIREPSDKRDRWLHSDYIRPALPQVIRLYRHCVNHINKRL